MCLCAIVDSARPRRASSSIGMWACDASTLTGMIPTASVCEWYMWWRARVLPTSSIAQRPFVSRMISRIGSRRRVARIYLLGINRCSTWVCVHVFTSFAKRDTRSGHLRRASVSRRSLSRADSLERHSGGMRTCYAMVSSGFARLGRRSARRSCQRPGPERPYNLGAMSSLRSQPSGHWRSGPQPFWLKPLGRTACARHTSGVARVVARCLANSGEDVQRPRPRLRLRRPGG